MSKVISICETVTSTEPQTIHSLCGASASRTMDVIVTLSEKGLGRQVSCPGCPCGYALCQDFRTRPFTAADVGRKHRDLGLGDSCKWYG